MLLPRVTLPVTLIATILSMTSCGSSTGVPQPPAQTDSVSIGETTAPPTATSPPAVAQEGWIDETMHKLGRYLTEPELRRVRELIDKRYSMVADELNSQFETAKSRMQALEGRMTGLNDDLTNARNRLETSLEQHGVQIKANEKRMQDLAQATSNLVSTLSDSEKRSVLLQKELGDLSTKASKLETELAIWKAKETLVMHYAGLCLWGLGVITAIRLLSKPLGRLTAVFLLKHCVPRPRHILS